MAPATFDRDAGGTNGLTDPGSFRDPSGFVYLRDGTVLRQVNRSFGERWDALSSNGLLGELQQRELLIPHEDAGLDRAFDPERAHAVIAPEAIELISYPYEWSFSQLKDAALLTLDAQALAMSRGGTLRDASAFNVQFRHGRPILIDTLSFEPGDPAAPWIGYRQFCEHFLAPLALMAHRDVRCGLLLREFIDGIPVDFAAKLLPGRTKLDVGLASHLHLHASAQRRSLRRDARESPGAGAAAASRPRTSGTRQAALIDSLRRTVAGLEWRPEGTAWADYADNTSYADTAARSKDELVRSLLEAAGGETVWDLGANTGRFSAIAAGLERRVIAWDTDPGATERHYRELRRSGERAVLPLVVDLANPSPGLGWANAERRSLAQRANADVVLALALVHHLVIGRNVRLGMVVDFLAGLAPQLIIEYIPASDPMVRELLSTRTDVEAWPTIEGFREACSSRFEVLEDHQIQASGRRLLRLVRR